MIIIDSENEMFKTSRFTVEKTRPCFSEGGSPWVMVFDNVPDKFLTNGNNVIFQ
ncbi:MAG: hypothetical protein ACI4SS_07110 [Clostridia bacterium]